MGVACVIKELVQKELDNGTLVELPLEIPIHRRTIGFAYHPANQAMSLKTFFGIFILKQIWTRADARVVRGALLKKWFYAMPLYKKPQKNSRNFKGHSLLNFREFLIFYTRFATFG